MFNYSIRYIKLLLYAAICAEIQTFVCAPQQHTFRFVCVFCVLQQLFYTMLESRSKQHAPHSRIRNAQWILARPCIGKRIFAACFCWCNVRLHLLHASTNCCKRTDPALQTAFDSANAWASGTESYIAS